MDLLLEGVASGKWFAVNTLCGHSEKAGLRKEGKARLLSPGSVGIPQTQTACNCIWVSL